MSSALGHGLRIDSTYYVSMYPNMTAIFKRMGKERIDFLQLSSFLRQDIICGVAPLLLAVFIAEIRSNYSSFVKEGNGPRNMNITLKIIM